MAARLCHSLFLAAGASCAVALHVASVISGSADGVRWWPLLPTLLAYGLAPLPIWLFARARDAENDIFGGGAGAANALDWACFSGCCLLTLVLGLPLVLWHAGVLDVGGAAFTLGGLATAVVTAVLGVVFSRVCGEAEDSWGGGVSLLSS